MKYSHHKYTWSKPFSSVRHQWELIGPHGGLHFHASISNGFGDTAGLEIHRTTPASYQKGDAPSQVPCWLLKVPCWHDGTSLYAIETLWPIIKSMLATGDHETIFRLLEQEADNHFDLHCEEA